MKINRVGSFIILFFLGVTSGYADFIPSTNDSPYKDHYGVVNAVYPKESRLVISDVSVVYNYASSFHNISDTIISDAASGLKPGTPIKFHVIQKSPHPILTDLKIISEQEYKQSQERKRDNR